MKKFYFLVPEAAAVDGQQYIFKVGFGKSENDERFLNKISDMSDNGKAFFFSICSSNSLEFAYMLIKNLGNKIITISPRQAAKIAKEIVCVNK